MTGLKQKLMLVMNLLIPILFITSCSFPTFLSDSSYDSEAVAAGKATIVSRMTLTAQSPQIVIQTPSPQLITETIEVQCVYAWAVKPDAELSAQFQSIIPITQQSLLEVGVAWYGENCIDITTNQIVRFSGMDLEFTISYAEHDLQSETWLGDQITIMMDLILRELEKHPELTRYPKNMHFVFNQAGERLYLNFTAEDFEELREAQGLSGADLFEALRN
jgi:hypothetical protein